MKKILFVCHGNICRSPMAEFIFKKLVSDKGLGGEFHVESRATSSEEIENGEGRPIYPNARAELQRNAIPFGEKRAIQLRRDDYGHYDLFIGMDEANIRNMHRIFGADPDGKVHKMMDYTARGGDVADPWYSRRFDIAFRDIYDGCEGLLAALAEDKHS